QCDVAVADDDGTAGRQVRGHVLEVRMGVVPTHEVDGGDAAFELFAGNPQRSVGLRTDGVDDGVVVLGDFGRLHVFTDLDVAEEAEARIQRRLLELRADRLDLRMVGCDPGAHQTPRGRQHLQHVDAYVPALT